MSVKKGSSFKTVQISDEEDYFLKLHYLLNPENMKLILNHKSQKLREIVLLKELYNKVYLGGNYTRNFEDNVRKKMQLKINFSEAKHLCNFINSLGIIETGKDPKKKVFYNANFVDENKDNIKMHSTSIENKQTIHNSTKNTSNNTKKDNINNLNTKIVNKTSIANIKKTLPRNQTIKITTEISKEDQKYDMSNLNKFAKRSSKDEKPSIISKEKPVFVKQIKTIKQNKISINTFPFNEKDNININNENENDEIVIDLVQVIDPPTITDNLPEDKKLKITEGKSKIVADREIKDFDNKILVKEEIYRYEGFEEKEADDKKNKRHSETNQIKNNNNKDSDE